MSDEKKKSTLDKIVMGAIIGTAVGSVLGMSLAPKKGEETREMLKDKKEDVKAVAKLGKETTVGIFRLAKKLLFGKKPSHTMKKIPNEMEITPEEYVDRD